MNFDALKTGRTLLLGFGREGRALERALARRAPEAQVEVICDTTPDVHPRHWPLRIGKPDSIAGPMADSIGHTPDRVLRSPGVPVDLPALIGWRKAGIPVTCISSLWFGARPDARVIAVTGSKGKSTTAALIAHLLAAAGKSVALGGNIGVPMLDLLDERPDWFVIELSSYQLADLQGHATAAVITRLFPEHQDWHGGVANYYAAKLRVADLVDGGPLWINGADAVLADAVAGLPNVRPVNVDGRFRVADDGIRHPGTVVDCRIRQPVGRAAQPGQSRAGIRGCRLGRRATGIGPRKPRVVPPATAPARTDSGPGGNNLDQRFDCDHAVCDACGPAGQPAASGTDRWRTGARRGLANGCGFLSKEQSWRAGRVAG